jgi:serine/threonine-protein kinase
MSPEQLAGDPSADHRIDIYAVGLLAYELLSGQSPFAATTAQGVLAAVLTREPKPLWEVRKDVPRKLSAIIMSCLSKMPGGRPPSAEALLDALDMIATASGEIRTREHRVPLSQRTTPIPAPIAFAADIPEPEPKEERRGRSKALVAGLAAVLLAATAAGAYVWQSGGPASPPLSIEPPNAANAAEPAAKNTVAAAPVITPIDSQAIDDAVNRRLAQAEAANSRTQTVVNVDSIRKRVQREIGDSISRANAKRIAAAQPASAQPTPQPVAASVAAAAAPAAAPAAAAAPAPAPIPSGKTRLALTDPRPSDQAALNAFSRTLIDALRVTLGNEESFGLIDQDSVRDAVARTKSRDEAAKILRPDVMVSPGYVNAGDAVNIIVTVWDLRTSSSYGIRVTSTRLDPAHPENYLGAIIQSVMKQLNDLSRAPTIYRR